MKVSTRGVRYRLRLLNRFLQSGFRLKKIVCYPERPKKRTVVFRICSHSGFYITNRLINEPDAVIAWENKTFKNDVAILSERCA